VSLTLAEQTGARSTGTSQLVTCIYRVTQKSKPLPNDQKIVLNRVKACQWD